MGKLRLKGWKGQIICIIWTFNRRMVKLCIHVQRSSKVWFCPICIISCCPTEGAIWMLKNICLNFSRCVLRNTYQSSSRAGASDPFNCKINEIKINNKIHRPPEYRCISWTLFKRVQKYIVYILEASAFYSWIFLQQNTFGPCQHYI